MKHLVIVDNNAMLKRMNYVEPKTIYKTGNAIAGDASRLGVCNQCTDL
ncbi:hypothetical protein JCM19239_7451 [Vibrio variabilis]|uniref:Uncharacterized protein n=1 Tax=Vibrio variabilis TaxID=990271 RepID=A0ABQ0JDR4_9VIBR|nr:hypothetical protein JCM19239_7451 [Vibrio variabilis]